MSCISHDGHCHEENEVNEKEEKKEKIEKILFIISILIFAFSFVLPVNNYIKIVMYVATILLAGYEIIIEGILNIFKLNFEEDTLMTIAVIAAFALGDFSEACLVILLFKLGEMIEDRAVDKSNSNIEEIVSIKAKNANLVTGDKTEVVDVNVLKVGDKILVKPGENVPVDCKVLSGESNIDTSSITGESKPVYIETGASILSGSINLDGKLICRVEKNFENSTASQIVDLVYEAQNNKGKTEEFITRFSKIYTPIVIIIAILIGVLPAILRLDFGTWIKRALVFLVASCPCSIVISVPLALYTCLGTISKRGMLIKGTKHIEDLSNAKVIAFDKTGTLTTGKMEIAEIERLNGHEIKEILEYAHNLERNSSHPIATSISKKIEENNLKEIIEIKEIKKYKEIAGCGICGEIDEKLILFGNKKLLDKFEINTDNLKGDRNYIVVENEPIGSISLKEETRKGIEKLFHNLKKVGIQNIAILTGDNEKNASKIAKELEIDEVYASLLPKEKLEKIEELKKYGKTIFVGDGINDSPVLASADFSISIGEGTEIANNTADAILISNNLSTLPDIIKISKKTMRILKENIVFSLLMKAIVLTLGVLGFAPIWLAVFADVGVTLLTVINSIRIK
mgnify:FL=1